MLDKIKNGDLVICPSNIKLKILKELNENKKILNIKFMTINEFKNNYFGTYDEKALYYLMNKYGFKYGVAREFLDNIYFDSDLVKSYYEELKENGLLIENKLFKNSLDNICVIGYDGLDNYIKDALNNYNVRYVSEDELDYKPTIYGFDKQSDEVAFVASDIACKLKTADINKIYLVGVNDDYESDVKRIFKLFNIPIDLSDSKEIYGTETVRIFLSNLKEKRDIALALEVTPKNDIYDVIVDVVNKYSFVNEVDDLFIQIITNELKNKRIKNNSLENVVRVTDLTSVDTSSDNYYYVLGFNQGVYPRIYHDDELIKDSDRKKLGLNTSLEKLINEKKHISKVIHNTKNLIITYKLKDNYRTYFPSPLIEDFGLSVIMNPEISYEYSHDYNKLCLARGLDNYIKYNEKSNCLEKLYSNYKTIPYQTYDNSYSGGNEKDIYDYLGGKLRLSYSSMNNYFLCAFRFYIQNILKLDPFVESFAILLGNLFHECLSHMYDEDFNVEKIYNDYLKEKDLSFKENFFVKKLYNDLLFVIETIKKQESYSMFDQVLTEKNIMVDKSSELKVEFVGIVDKIKYKEEDGKTLVAIIDYKTGNVETTLDNINHGLHLQLPVYIYLTKNGMHKDIQITGFYLQKILNNVSMDADNAEDEKYKSLRLDGYTINDERLISKFDSTYDNSEVIKGMKTTKSGFSHYTKLIDNSGVDKVVNLVDEKIDEVISATTKGNFDINPKRLGDKVIGCNYCKFKDLCFRKEEDIVNLEGTKFKDIIGGEDNA